MKKTHTLLSLLTLASSVLMLASCGSTSSGPIYVGPDENGGGQVDTDGGTENNDIETLKEVLNELKSVRNYTYETTYNLSGYQEQVIDYYGEHHFYEENIAYPEYSFGMAEEAYEGGDKSIFYYYVEEKDGEMIVNPSLYEYSNLNVGSDIKPLTELYGSFGIAGLHNIYSDAMDELSGIKLANNKYQITSSSMYQIFQYMTQMGTSISSSMTSCIVEILDAEKNIIRVTISLGETGDIVSTLTPNNNTKYAFMDEKLTSGEIKGVAYYEDVVDLFENKLNKNNYTISQINYKTATSTDVSTLSVKLTQNYFLIDYNEESEALGYQDWGMMLLPSGTEVTVHDFDTNEDTVHKNNYTTCYAYKIVDGEVVFYRVVGPNETEDLKFVEVETYDDLAKLSSDQLGDEYVYIVKDENYTYVYSIIDGVTGEMGFKKYNPWYSSVGDFFIDGASASFYTSSTIIGNVARYYFEKNVNKENTYYTTDTSVLSMLGSGLFGWGVFSDSTWINYIFNSTLTVNKDENQEIIGANLALDVATASGDNQVSMDFTNIGTTEIPVLKDVYDNLTK